MPDGDISSIEFHNALTKAEKYCQHAGIRNQAKTKVRQITKGFWISCVREKRRQRIFLHQILQILQIFRMSMPLKAWSPSTLQHVVLWPIKALKLTWNLWVYQLQELRLYLLSCLPICHHPLPCFPEGASKPAFLPHQPYYWLYTPNIFSLYLIIVSLVAFSSSYLDISRRCIFNAFAAFNNFNNVLIYYFVTLN